MRNIFGNSRGIIYVKTCFLFFLPLSLSSCPLLSVLFSSIIWSFLVSIWRNKVLSMSTKIKRFIVRKMCVGEKQRCDYTTFQRNLRRVKSWAASCTPGRLGASQPLLPGAGLWKPPVSRATEGDLPQKVRGDIHPVAWDPRGLEGVGENRLSRSTVSLDQQGQMKGVKTQGICQTPHSPPAGNRLIQLITCKYLLGKRKDGSGGRTQTQQATPRATGNCSQASKVSQDTPSVCLAGFQSCSGSVAAVPTGARFEQMRIAAALCLSCPCVWQGTECALSIPWSTDQEKLCLRSCTRAIHSSGSIRTGLDLGDKILNFWVDAWVRWDVWRGECIFQVSG